MKGLAIIICSMVLACGLALAGGPATVELVGLGVAKPDPNNKMMSRIMGLQPGTRVGLEVILKTHEIIELNSSESKLTTFKDDKGKNLLPEKQSFGGPFSFPSVADDKKSLNLSIATKVLPSKGAKQVTVEGELALLVGSDLKTMKTAEMAFEPGKKLSLGKTTVTISSTGKPKWGGGNYSIQLKGNTSLKFIQGISIISGGKTLKGDWSSSGSMGMMGMKTYTSTFKFKEKIEKGVLALTYFNKHETVKVPLRVTAGLGL